MSINKNDYKRAMNVVEGIELFWTFEKDGKKYELALGWRYAEGKLEDDKWKSYYEPYWILYERKDQDDQFRYCEEVKRFKVEGHKTTRRTEKGLLKILKETDDIEKYIKSEVKANEL